MFQRTDFERFQELQRGFENRCKDLCRMYEEMHQGSSCHEDFEITHAGSHDGTLRVEWGSEKENQTLSFPLEYLWRTDEEVSVLMRMKG